LARERSGTFQARQCALSPRLSRGSHTLRQDEVPERIPYARQPRTLPEVLSGEEVVRFLEVASSLKCRIALTTAYATGMRVSEVVAVQARSLTSFFKRGLRRVQACLQMLCGLPDLWSVWRN
jgi:integrase